jgi:hypothetical protein
MTGDGSFDETIRSRAQVLMSVLSRIHVTGSLLVFYRNTRY